MILIRIKTAIFHYKYLFGNYYHAISIIFISLSGLKFFPKRPYANHPRIISPPRSRHAPLFGSRFHPVEACPEAEHRRVPGR